MNFERFYGYAKKLEGVVGKEASAIMDVMEPLPLGLKWITVVAIREGYGVGFMNQYYNEIKSTFLTILSVLETSTYVDLKDGSLYAEVPEGYTVEGNFIYTTESSVKFLETMEKYMKSGDVVDDVVQKINNLQGEMTKTVDSVCASEVDVPTHKSVVETLDENEKSVPSTEEIVVDNGTKSESSSETDIQPTRNPFLNKRFLKDAKARKTTYALSREIHDALQDPDVFLYVDSEDTVNIYKSKNLQKHLDKKSFPGKYYPDYRVWFDKSHKEYILWIFEIESTYNDAESMIVDMIVDRPPWKWIDVDNFKYVDEPTSKLNNFEYGICGQNTPDIYKYLLDNDMKKQFEMDQTTEISKAIVFKGKAYEKMMNTPKGKLVNIDTFEYVKSAKYMDPDYWWCTDNEKTWKHKKSIRKLLLRKFCEKCL